MGCGGGGNPIKFLMQIKNISFTEALQELASLAGIKLQGLKEENIGPDYSHYYKIMETAHKFFKYNLTNTTSGDEAIKYLLNRGIDRESIDAFEIGLAPDKPDALYNVLKSAGFNELDMCDLGLVKMVSMDSMIYLKVVLCFLLRMKEDMLLLLVVVFM